jgi:hypothetical protein
LGTLKYTTFDFTNEEIEEAKKRNHENPMLISRDGGIIALYSEKEKIRIKFYISYFGFDEGMGKHELNYRGEGYLTCTCGVVCKTTKRITAEERFQEHKMDMLRTENKLLGKEDGNL